MRVKMVGPAFKLLNKISHLCLVFLHDFSKQWSCSPIIQRPTEMTFWIDERLDLAVGIQRTSERHVEMDPQSKAFPFFEFTDARTGEGQVHQKCRARDNAFVMASQDSTGDTRRQVAVIGINDQACMSQSCLWKSGQIKDNKGNCEVPLMGH